MLLLLNLEISLTITKQNDSLFFDRLEKILKVELQQTSGKALDEGQLVSEIERKSTFNLLLVRVMIGVHQYADCLVCECASRNLSLSH